MGNFYHYDILSGGRKSMGDEIPCDTVCVDVWPAEHKSCSC